MTVKEIVHGEHVTRLAKHLRKASASLDGGGRMLLDLWLVRAMSRPAEDPAQLAVPAIFHGASEPADGGVPLLRVASMALGIDALAIGPKQDDPRAIGLKKNARHAIGPKQDDPRAIGLKKDARRAIGPKQDDPRAIGPKQDDPGTPPKLEWGVIMAERGGEDWGVIMAERGGPAWGVIMAERKALRRPGKPGVHEHTITGEQVAGFARWLAGVATELEGAERALLDLLLIRGGEAPPEDPRVGRVPVLFYDPDDEERSLPDATRLVALALGVGTEAIGPKQDDPGVPPKLEWGVSVGERGTETWSTIFARRAER